MPASRSRTAITVWSKRVIILYPLFSMRIFSASYAAKSRFKTIIVPHAARESVKSMGNITTHALLLVKCIEANLYIRVDKPTRASYSHLSRRYRGRPGYLLRHYKGSGQPGMYLPRCWDREPGTGP